MKDSCLVVLHKIYDEKSVDFFKKHYSNFKKVIHIAPLYNGVEENILTTYENKLQMSGYLAQCVQKLSEIPCRNYIFTTDDVVLYDSANISDPCEKINIENNEIIFSDKIFAVDLEHYSQYNWVLPSLINFCFRANGAEVNNFIPEKADFRKICQNLGIKTPRLQRNTLNFILKNLVEKQSLKHEFFYDLEYGNINIKNLIEIYKPQEPEKNNITLYPFVASNSNVMIIPQERFKTFARYCGIFSALRLHYNIAFAMSAVLSSDKIKFMSEKEKNLFKNLKGI